LLHREKHYRLDYLFNIVDFLGSTTNHYEKGSTVLDKITVNLDCNETLTGIGAADY